MPAIFIFPFPYRIHHQKSRYVYDLFYKRKAISRGRSVLQYVLIVTMFTCCCFRLFFDFLELYEFCLEEGYADKNLIAKWKKVCVVCLSLCVCVLYLQIQCWTVVALKLINLSCLCFLTGWL